MSMTLGRCSLQDGPNAGFTVSGKKVSFTVDISPAAASDVDETRARRQQLSGLVDNLDEDVVPFTWSEDSAMDGFYRVTDVSIPHSQVALTSGYIEGVQISMEQVTGFASPSFEVTTQSVVRTNGHGITAPPTFVITSVGAYPTESYNLGAYLTTAWTSVVTRNTESGGTAKPLTAWYAAAPTTLSSFRLQYAPSSHYIGACKVEVLYGSTWYTVVGRNIPPARVWRISNDFVRLTSANGAASGTFEVWDQTAGAWKSQVIRHNDTNGSFSGIGGGQSSNQPIISVIRNSPEQVTVRVITNINTYAYTVQRGAALVSMSWTADTAAYRVGIGFATAVGCTAFTGGIRATANDANGNRLCFGTAAALSSDLANGTVWPTAGATSGSLWVGVDFGGVGATAATDLRDQFLGAVSWRQRAVVR